MTCDTIGRSFSVIAAPIGIDVRNREGKPFGNIELSTGYATRGSGAA
jgi:hypothetical protein